MLKLSALFILIVKHSKSPLVFSLEKKTINVRENREEQSRMDKPETLVTLDT
jgi:hypothetical protein